MTDNSAAMAEAKNLDAGRRRLLELAEAKGQPLNSLSLAIGKNRGYLENYVRKGSPRQLALEDRIELARILGPGINPHELSVDIHRRGRSSELVATSNKPGVVSSHGDARTGGLYTPLTETVSVIGSVQSGAWKEAYQLPESEWLEMSLPADARFPGITRFALKNDGHSMNKVCRPGGTWVFVRFSDLTGQGPSVGQYVIVERRRPDGLVEATAKRFDIGPGGKPCLFPESDDPTFGPIPFAGEDGDEIAVIGRVTDILNPV